MAEVFLFGPGECDGRIPVPPLVRRYRYNVIARLELDGKSLAPPYLGASHVRKRVNAPAVGPTTTVMDYCGGLPINMIAQAGRSEWSQPLLQEFEEDDVVSLLATGKGRAGDVDVSFERTSANIGRLLNGESVVVARQAGGWARMRLSKKALKSAPKLHLVRDVSSFAGKPVVADDKGRLQTISLQSTHIAKLLNSEPALVRRGRQLIVLLRPVDSDPPRPPDDGAGDGGGGGGGGGGSGGSGGGGTPIVATVYTPPLVIIGTYTPLPATPPQPEVGLLLPFEQTWTLESYERGELISSIALTPLEETTIEVFTWDRRKSSVEDTASSEAERISEAQSVDRDTRDIFNELTKTGQIKRDLNGELSVGSPGQFGIKLGGGINNTQTANDVARRTRQQVEEATLKATEKVTSSRQTKITESEEQGSETRVTRKLRNANQAYPVTYNYFALLARYGVGMRCVKESACPVLMIDSLSAHPNVDIDFVRLNEGPLRKGLLDSSFAAGFDAARTLWTRDRACAELDACCGGVLPGSASATLSTYAPATQAAASLAAALASLPSSVSLDDFIGYFVRVVARVEPEGNHSAVTVERTAAAMRRALFLVAAEHLLGQAAWQRLRSVLMGFPASPTPAQLSLLNTTLSSIDPAALRASLEPDDALKDALKVFLANSVRQVYAGRGVDSLRQLTQHPTGNVLLDAQVLATAVTPLLSDSVAAVVISAVIIDDFERWIGLRPEHGGIPSLLQLTADAVAAWAAQAADAAADAERADAAARAASRAALQAAFPPGKVLVARERFDALRQHIVDNRDYYAFLLLTEKIARGAYTPPSSIAMYMPFVSLRPVAVVDGKLCFPFNLDLAPELADLVNKCLVDLQEPDKASTVHVPTPGYVVEPKLSACSAAEPFVESARESELLLRAAQASQAQAEARRRTARLGLPDPNLDPFDPPAPALRVSVDRP